MHGRKSLPRSVCVLIVLAQSTEQLSVKADRLTCGQRHHTSICNNSSTDGLLLTTQPESSNKVIYPVVVVEVEGVQCRALLDTGAGRSYASAALLDLVKSRPRQSQVRTIEMMLGIQTKRVELFSLKVEILKKDFSLEVEVARVERPKLLEIDNPGYSEILRGYSPLLARSRDGR